MNWMDRRSTHNYIIDYYCLQSRECYYYYSIETALLHELASSEDCDEAVIRGLSYQFYTGAEGNPLQHALQQALDYIQISLHLPKGPCQLFQLLLSVIDDDFLYLYSFLVQPSHIHATRTWTR